VDSVWGMTVSCWQQDPARRPTMARVVGFLREWLVFSLLVEPNSLRASCSYTLRATNPSLASWRPAGKVDDVTNPGPVSMTPTNGTQSLTTPQHPRPPSSQARDSSEGQNPMFNTHRSGVSHDSCGSSFDSLSGEHRAPFISGNYNGAHNPRR